MAIELPAKPGTRHIKYELLDFGFVQRGVGGGVTRIDRPGNRYRVTAIWPPMHPADARVFETRMARARSEGLRIPIPLLGESQGTPGRTVVDGTDSGGTVLKLRGGNPGYQFKEGYWLTLVHDGKGSAHRVNAPAAVAADGTAELAVEPPLRVFPDDGDEVNAAKPWIEGPVTALEPFEHPVTRRITLTCTIEEDS